MDDDRLVVETLRSANDYGADCANFVKVVGTKFSGEKVCALICRDELTGAEFIIDAKHFVSTVGPWTDLVAEKILPSWKKIMRPSKGIHLTFKRDRLPLSSAVVMASDKDDRIIFGIPRHEMIVIGTTDTDYSGDPAEVHSSSEDVEYLLNVVEEYFPGANLRREDIVASYSGVRPLVNDGSQTESSTSREHVIIKDPRNVTFIAGGKYTTYRLMAEQVVNAALQSMSMQDQAQFAHSATKVPLNPQVTMHSYSTCQSLAEFWAGELGLAVSEAQYLLERHGLEIEKMMAHKPKVSSSGRRKMWEYELLFALENTMCIRLVDFYLRRSPLFLAETDHGQQYFDDLAKLFAEYKGLNEKQLDQEAEALKNHLKTEMAWQNAPH